MPGRILIIEDEPDIAEVLRYCFRKSRVPDTNHTDCRRRIGSRARPRKPACINTLRHTLTGHERSRNLPTAPQRTDYVSYSYRDHDRSGASSCVSDVRTKASKDRL